MDGGRPLAALKSSSGVRHALLAALRAPLAGAINFRTLSAGAAHSCGPLRPSALFAPAEREIETQMIRSSSGLIERERPSLLVQLLALARSLSLPFVGVAALALRRAFLALFSRKRGRAHWDRTPEREAGQTTTNERQTTPRAKGESQWPVGDNWRRLGPRRHGQ